MAAYAAAVSLMHILDLIKNHPSPPISFDQQQLHSLTEVVAFLQEFLEGYVSPFSYSDEADPLEMRIADAVYAAEDVIESYIVDNIHHAAETTHNDDDEQIRHINFYEGLQKVIEAMDLIKKEVMGLVKKKGGPEAELPRTVSVDAAIFKSSSTGSKSAMVGFEDELLQLKERLVGGDSSRQIIPIVGMGGIGKTTLARNVFADKLIEEHFDVCLWATVSLDHNIEQTLRQVLSQSQGHSSGEKSVGELGEELHRYLFGKRYLLVLDDMWGIEVWDKMRFFFPECGKRSRVIVTTRMSNLAAHLSSSDNSLCMSFLNEVDSWTLFSKTVFGSGGSVVPELREIGEKIVGKCKGLPLSIAVIGGLLAKSERTQGYWEYIEENLSSIVNLENEEYCLRVLKLSYNHLPAYLKPCFLYMGMFDEDKEIKVSKIIHLWVSEGFLKPKKGKKNLETVAREYLQELVDRNLVLAVDELKLSKYLFESKCELGLVGNGIRLCKVHDLVRDLSLREAQKQRFYYMIFSKEHNYPISHRRIVIPQLIEDIHQLREIMLESSSNPRSYMSHRDSAQLSQLSMDFRLLRTLYSHSGNYYNNHEYNQNQLFGLVNARLLSVPIQSEWWNTSVLDSSISRLWSLHTLILHGRNKFEGAAEFWNMHQLKHVEFISLELRLPQPPPPNNGSNVVIMENLHTLIGMFDLYLNEDVVRRLPNLRILDVRYKEEKIVSKEVHCLSYLQRLIKLESFSCCIEEANGEDLERVCFPQSLKQILLKDKNWFNKKIELEGVLQKLGWLPFLEEAVIQYGVFGRGEWEATQGQFPKLKILELAKRNGLRKWTLSGGSSHFPLLEKLILEDLEELEEIPSEIGEIETLRSIKVRNCSESAVLSAKRIVEDQEEFYGEDQLSFRVLVEDKDTAALASLATPNFQVQLGE